MQSQEPPPGSLQESSRSISEDSVIVRAGRLYRPLCAAAISASILNYLLNPQLGIEGFFHSTAYYGAAAIIAWAVLALPWTRLERRWMRHADQQVTSSALQAGIILGVALAVGAVLILPTEALLTVSLPSRISYREEVAEVLSVPLSLSASALVATAWRKVRHPQLRTPWWLFAVSWVLSTLVIHDDLDLYLPGQATRFDWLTLLVLTATAILTALQQQKDSAPAYREWPAKVGMVGLPVVITISLMTIGEHRYTQAMVSAHAPVAASFFELVRNQFDLDADGFSGRLGGWDCDDSREDVHPAALEIVGNGVDDNCAGGDLEVYESPYTVPLPPAPNGWQPRPLILITVDALRADTITSPVGDLGVPAPNLHAFARDSAHFLNAYATASTTDQTLRSLFTGHYPMDFYSHGTFMGHEVMLAEFLQNEGFATSMISQIIGLNRYLYRGYDHVDDELSASNANFMGKTSRETTDRAIAEFQRRSQEGTPFFLWVHYFDPHADYLPDAEAPFKGVDLTSLYRQEVWQTDREIGRLLQALGDADYFATGSVVVTADHGELVGERAHVGHALWLDEEVLRVPVIIRAPDLPSATIDTRVSTVDLMTTMLEITTGRTLPTDGRSLLPIARGVDLSERPVFARAYYDGRTATVFARAVIDGRYKLVQNFLTGSESLHDLTMSDADGTNLIDLERERAIALHQLMGERWDLSMNNQVAMRKFSLLPRRALTAEEELDAQKELLKIDCLIWRDEAA
ncbi:MAG: sulfatase-like hydrolase/transferase, partial [Nannocystaceae bacterium]